MQKYTDFSELPIIYRGDDEATLKPYGGVATFRDGRFILASRYRGRLAMVGADGLVISSCDPLSKRIGYDKLICYGIALHTDEKILYMLVGEEDGNELYVISVLVMPPIEPNSPSSVQGSSTTIANDPIFKWVPSADIRLPSVAARDTNYQDYSKRRTAQFAEPVLFGYRKVPTEDGEFTFIKAGPFYWDWDKREPKDVPDDFYWGYEAPYTAEWRYAPFTLLEWVASWEATSVIDNPSLGPIIIDYPTCKPMITTVGSRVMVSCTHAQLYSYNRTLEIPYQDIESGYLGHVPQGGLRDAFFGWMKKALLESGLTQNPSEDDTPDTPPDMVIAPDTLQSWQDVMKEGVTWWVDEVRRRIYVTLSFQQGWPLTSVVTLHPDLGTIDGIYHISFSYPIQNLMGEYTDVTMFIKDRVTYVNYNALYMSGASPFWEWRRFDKRYAMDNHGYNTDPRAIDMDFYLDLVKHWFVQYLRYNSTVNPYIWAKRDVYKSRVPIAETIFSGYTTVDEAMVSVHAPTFD